ncbi:MAG: tRNA 2-thiouridine(34) synthase MnmA [Bacteroidales bacterium]|nr:tRNA 2-thiouridine(34) synthase MnmA [Bacteroidales bacterium]MBN2757883.1 tRNA 2-thiouridine(34) synthase MnmA [Bacteroidales bacterium]
MNNEKVLMALSGGVDSSVAAILLKNQGYDIIGVTLRIYKSIDSRSNKMEQGINDANILAVKLDIPFYVFDVHKDFEETVIQDFISEYKVGRTPNPCALCNLKIKWKHLINIADELGCKYIATGHYAQINNKNGRYFISKGKDDLKDQSYFLWRLDQELLKRTIFPLGAYKKEEIKSIADKNGFKKIAEQKESYDICFVPDGDYREFLKSVENTENDLVKGKKGYIISENGTILGEHSGIQNYTIGQRKGLGIASTEPLYIVKINPENNLIILGKKESLNNKSAIISDFKLTKYNKIPENITVKTKVRYKSAEIESKLTIIDDKIKIEFSENISALTPGQSAVFYENDDLIGGGIVETVIY